MVTAVTTFITNTIAIYTTAGQNTAFLQLQRNLVIVAEPVTNKLIINVSPEYCEEVMNIIAAIDVQPAQVCIDTILAEVDMTGFDEVGCEIGLQTPVLFQRGVTATAASGQQSGFPFGGANSVNELGGDTTIAPATVGVQGVTNLGLGRANKNSNLGGFVFSMSSDAVSVLIRALATQERVNIISAPTIVTTDNQAARILVGSSFPYISSSVMTTATTGIPTVTNSITYKDLGIQLQVTPKIAPDGTVTMRVIPEVSSEQQNTTIQVSNSVFATAFNVQTIETTVIVHDGETVAIGGLIAATTDRNETKVPWLGDLPWIGAAFRYRQQTKNKTELVVLLTPRVTGATGTSGWTSVPAWPPRWTGCCPKSPMPLADSSGWKVLCPRGCCIPKVPMGPEHRPKLVRTRGRCPKAAADSPTLWCRTASPSKRRP